MEIGGIAGLIILIADIYAIVKILDSGADTLNKVIWILVVLVFPLLGVIAWYFFGPGGGKA